MSPAAAASRYELTTLWASEPHATEESYARFLRGIFADITVLTGMNVCRCDVWRTIYYIYSDDDEHEYDDDEHEYEYD